MGKVLGRGLDVLLGPRQYNPADPYASIPPDPPKKKEAVVDKSMYALYRCPACGTVLVPGVRVAGLGFSLWSKKCPLCFGEMGHSGDVRGDLV